MLFDLISHQTFWIILGLILMVAEALIPTVLIFFGLSSWIVATLVAAGLIASFTSQLIAFALIGVLLLIALRKMCKTWLTGGSIAGDGNLDDTGIMGSIAIVNGTFEGYGSVSLNGSSWMAKSDSQHQAGDKVKVIGRDGTMLIVQSL